MNKTQSLKNYKFAKLRNYENKLKHGKVAKLVNRDRLICFWFVNWGLTLVTSKPYACI